MNFSDFNSPHDTPLIGLRIDELTATLAARDAEVAKQAETLRISGLLVEALQEQCAAVNAKIERLREALTPSGETKAAYMGEFTYEERTDDHYSHTTRTVPWTTIKEIMAAILNRADAALAKGEASNGQ